MEHLHERSLIRAALKTSTQLYHDRLEAALDLLHRPLTLADYRVLLARFYGFYAPIEAALAQVFTAAACPLDFTRRRKIPLLERDLHILGFIPTNVLALPQCRDLPQLDKLSQALGCLYVLEGATLGGQIISRHLQTLFGLTTDSGCAFFTSYGAHVGPMWKAFGEVLISHATTTEREEVMIAAACATFVAFERWMTGQEE